MKTAIIVFAAVMAIVTADQCTTLRRIKVKQQWAQAYSTGIAREDFGEAVWKSVFVQAPLSVSLFSRVNGADPKSPKFRAHVARVNGALDMSISLLDHPETLDAALQHLRVAHKERAIPAHYFDIFVNALHAVVPATLGRCFDEDAWKACSAYIIDGIRQPVAK